MFKAAARGQDQGQDGRSNLLTILKAKQGCASSRFTRPVPWFGSDGLSVNAVNA
jgi:hypothetical protein